MGDQDQAPLDLNEILDSSPEPRRATLNASSLALGRFGIGELLELTRVAGVAPDKLGEALRKGDGATKGRVIVGLAWLIARRREPELTYEDVATWAIEVRSDKPDPTPRPPRKRGARSS